MLSAAADRKALSGVDVPDVGNLVAGRHQPLAVRTEIEAGYDVGTGVQLEAGRERGGIEDVDPSFHSAGGERAPSGLSAKLNTFSPI